MEAVTVPDCSHHVCSECGVCGDDFGDNVVVEPPPLPAFDGTCEKDIAKTQKVRIKFAKLGSMACVGMPLLRAHRARYAGVPCIGGHAWPRGRRHREAFATRLWLVMSEAGTLLLLPSWVDIGGGPRVGGRHGNRLQQERRRVAQGLGLFRISQDGQWNGTHGPLVHPLVQGN